jgi:ABC-type transporter Mla subunit MlaD
MYDTESDTAPQLEAFLGVLGAHRQQLERQLEDLRLTITEISSHEARCQALLVQARRKTKLA